MADQLAKNVEIGKRVQEIVVFLVGEAGEYSEEDKARFWLRLLAEMEKLTVKMIPPTKPKSDRMSYKEATEFEDISMPFGQHTGKKVRDVPASYLGWLASQESFSDKVIRYVRSSKFQIERGEDDSSR